MTKDKREEVKYILEKWGCSSNIIELEKSEIERLKEIIEGMTNARAVVYSHTPKGSSVDSPVERAYFNTLGLCEKRLERLRLRVEEYIREKEYIDNIIEKMDFEKQYIIKAKYADRLSWDVIAAKYPHAMSLRNFYRLHSEALDHIYEQMEKDNMT